MSRRKKLSTREKLEREANRWLEWVYKDLEDAERHPYRRLLEEDFRWKNTKPKGVKNGS